MHNEHSHAVTSLLRSGIAKRDELQGLGVAGRISDTVNAATLGENHVSSPNGELADGFHTEAEDVLVHGRKTFVRRVVAVAHVSYPFSRSDIVQLLGAHVLVDPLEHPGRKRDFMEVNERPPSSRWMIQRMSVILS